MTFSASRPNLETATSAASTAALHGLGDGIEEVLLPLTAIASPGICPEISLRIGSDMAALWESIESVLNIKGLAPPFWSIAWPGGQALARYMLDHPHVVAGRRILDIGAGSGLCAIAAAMAGAGNVTASEVDPLAGMAIRQNARLNNVAVQTEILDMIGREVPGVEIVLAADLWYEQHLGYRVTRWLRQLAANGVTVFVGDSQRRYFPRRNLIPLASYLVPSSEAFEHTSTIHAGVWQMMAIESL